MGRPHRHLRRAVARGRRGCHGADVGQYGPDGEWFEEGRGVEPNIRVENTPEPLARGEDPQLQRAIEEMEQAPDDYTPVQPDRPASEDRTPSGEGN